MNDENKVNIENKEFDVKVKGKTDKKYKIKITDEKVDFKDKKEGDTVEINATIAEDKKDAPTTPLKLKGKVNKSLYRDSISINGTDKDEYKEFESEIKPYTRTLTKPATLITIAAVAILLIGGI